MEVIEKQERDLFELRERINELENLQDEEIRRVSRGREKSLEKRRERS